MGLDSKEGIIHMQGVDWWVIRALAMQQPTAVTVCLHGLKPYSVNQ